MPQELNNNSITRTQAEPLSEKLKEIGFEKTDFEPVVLNRFIVNIDGIPSYIICGARMPHCTFYRNKERKTVEPKWESLILFLYNPVSLDTEKQILEIGKKDEVDISVRYLSPTGEPVTHWKIKAEMTAVDYGEFDWKNTGDPNIIQLTFKIKDVTLV